MSHRGAGKSMTIEKRLESQLPGRRLDGGINIGEARAGVPIGHTENEKEWGKRFFFLN